MRVYFGSYTRPHPLVPRANGIGITVCDFDPQSGGLIFRAATNVLNPSYLALDEGGEWLFAASENFDSEGAVQAFRRRPDGTLLPINSQPSAGRATCHVGLTPGGRICASSYLDGGLAVFPFRAGKIAACEFLFRYGENARAAGRGKNSHAHQSVVSPDGRRLYVCDCGLDGLWRHELAAARVVSMPPEFIPVPAGCGPRHLVFHPTLPRAYVICEVNAHLLVYDWDADSGNLSLAEQLPTLPDDWNGQPAAAAIRIHPSATALHVSNRNHDSLTTFKLDGSGHATFGRRLPAGGKTPRDFAMDPSGRWLLCANQNSNHVAIHELDAATGLPTGRTPARFPVGTPACVLFAS